MPDSASPLPARPSLTRTAVTAMLDRLLHRGVLAWAVPVSCVIEVSMFSPYAVITAVTTWITPVRRKGKAILRRPSRCPQVSSGDRARHKIWTQEGGGDCCAARTPEHRGGHTRSRHRTQNPPAMVERSGVRRRIPEGAPRSILAIRRTAATGEWRRRLDVTEDHGGPERAGLDTGPSGPTACWTTGPRRSNWKTSRCGSPNWSGPRRRPSRAAGTSEVVDYENDSESREIGASDGRLG
jgi:hypothetical protein